MNTSKEECMICGKPEDKGLHIVTSFICCHCEQELVSTDVKDERYPFLVSKMKNIFLEYKANA